MKTNLYIYAILLGAWLGGSLVYVLKPQTKHITFHMNYDKSDLSFMQLDEAKGTVMVYEKDGDVNQTFKCVGGFEK